MSDLEKKFHLPKSPIRLRQACEKYWEMKGWRFVNSMKKLREELGEGMLVNVNKKSFAYFEGLRDCPNCGNSLGIKKRDKLTSALYLGKLHCERCKNKVSIKLSQVEDLSLEEARSFPRVGSEMLVLMQNAFNEEVYIRLTSLKYNFLVQYCSTPNIIVSSKRLGLSEVIGTAIFNELCDKCLIDPLSNYIIPELRIRLINEGVDQKAKSIFGNGTKILELFKFLKRDNVNVFVKVPICQFLITEFAEKYFVEDWHRNYFITTMVDFLVTDLKGLPKFTVDYFSTGFDSLPLSEKLNFRKTILSECGVPHYSVRGTDLNYINLNFNDFVFPDDLDYY